MIDLEDFDPILLSQPSLSVFLVATYGEGEPTDNATKFFKHIKNEEDTLPPDSLRLLNFAVFGLGNRQYEHFNRMGMLAISLFGVLPLIKSREDHQCLAREAWRKPRIRIWRRRRQ